MTEEMKKDMILQTIAQQPVPLKRTTSPLQADCQSPSSGLRTVLLLMVLSLGVIMAWGQETTGGHYVTLSAITGETSIYYPDDFVYTTDEADHTYTDTPQADCPCWNDDSSELTKTWNLTGAAGYATVGADGTLHVTNLPTTDDVTITLTYTISDGANSVDASLDITLYPKAIHEPTIAIEIDEETNKLVVSSDQNYNIELYYTAGPSEPATPDPTGKAEQLYDDTNRPVIGTNVACIKARAIHHTDRSTVTVYNILNFSNIIGSGESQMTVAPLAVSCDRQTPTGMKAYIVSNVLPWDNSAILKEVGYIPKDVPVLLVDKGVSPNTGSTHVNLEFLDLESYEGTPVDASMTAANQLKISDGTVKVADAQVYMYKDGLFVLTSAGTLANGRYYMNNPNYRPSAAPEDDEDSEETEDSGSGSSGSRLRLVFGDTTGIKEIVNKESSNRASVYTLDGRHLSGQPTRKGIYISNGRKVVIR